MRAFLCGSGLGAMGLPETCNAIIRLANRSHTLKVVYLGTATYDLPEQATIQTKLLREAGCIVTCVDIALCDSEPDALEAIAQADVILGSGGNTLFAMDRFAATGVDRLLREASERGAVMCGGSAGAIMFFDGGHSDSGDPTSFKRAMVDHEVVRDDSSWKYIRVSGLGLLPGLLCPHLDQVQSNGVLRCTDFESMMLKHPGELGIGLDHWAALHIDGEHYKVISFEGKSGSVLPDGSFGVGGVPGLWTFEVVDGKVHTSLASNQGLLANLLRPAATIDLDPNEQVIRNINKI